MKLDLGCGTRKKPGFVGVDARAFEGVDVVCDLANGRWPWADDSIDETFCAHVIEHLTAPQRIHFVNELCRVMKRGATARLVAPHWSSSHAFGDLTHQWPPVSEMWFFYLSRDWRSHNAPHNDAYTCDFDAHCAYSINPAFLGQSAALQQLAVKHYREAAMEIVATLTKR